MKHIILRTAAVALFAAGSFTALAAEPTPKPHGGPDTPIPICWQCGHGGSPSGN